MTNKADLISLAERVEKAKGKDRELDLAIYEALGATPPTEQSPLYWTAPDKLSRHYEALIPHYTGSIDAAMRLVPEGYWLTIETGTQRVGPSFEWPVVEIGSQATGNRIWRGQAKTLPLALTAASLRAKAMGE